jgi:uncharacterized membrane protein
MAIRGHLQKLTRTFARCSTRALIAFGSRGRLERLQELSVRSLVIILLLLTSPAIAQTPGFWLVGVPSGATSTEVRALSQDGSAAAGLSNMPARTPGFRWTVAGGREDFGLEPGMPNRTFAWGISGDGNTIVGSMDGPGPTRAYRRVGSGPLQDLGPLLSYQSSKAEGASGDGGTIVGFGYSFIVGPPIGQAFRWTAPGGMQGLGWLPGSDPYSAAVAISRDGTTIVGESGYIIPQAFVWRQGTGMQGLPALQGASTLYSAAYAVNPSGSIIVGEAIAPDNQYHMVRWTASGAQDLGLGAAYAVSDDGSVVGGAGGLVWTEATGSILVGDYLAQHGVQVPAGWTMPYLWAISGDGLTFGGTALSSTGVYQGFVATIPAPPGAVLVLAPVLVLLRRRRGIR